MASRNHAAFVRHHRAGAAIFKALAEGRKVTMPFQPAFWAEGSESASTVSARTGSSTAA